MLLRSRQLVANHPVAHCSVIYVQMLTWKVNPAALYESDSRFTLHDIVRPYRIRDARTKPILVTHRGLVHCLYRNHQDASSSETMDIAGASRTIRVAGPLSRRLGITTLWKQIIDLICTVADSCTKLFNLFVENDKSVESRVEI